MRHSKINQMTRCALSAAMMAVCAWITVPGPVPFTLQTFGLFLTLELLGGKRGTWAIATYLLLGVLGLPVFSGFRGGISVLLGATGGYLTGFVACGLVYRALTKCRVSPLPALVCGMAACYTFGTAWFYLAYAGGKSLWAVVSTCVLPFLIPDALKLALAHVVAQRLKKAGLS